MRWFFGLGYIAMHSLLLVMRAPQSSDQMARVWQQQQQQQQHGKGFCGKQLVLK